VNYIEVRGQATTGSPQIYANGSDTNIFLEYYSKGTGNHLFYTNGEYPSRLQQFVIAHTASAVNYLQVTGAATGGNPTLSAQGSDADSGLIFTAKGNGVNYVKSSVGTYFQNVAGANQFAVTATASAVNYLTVTGATTTNDPTITAAGSDTNIDVQIVPKGTGGLRFAGPLLPNNLAGTSGQVLTSAGAGAVPTWTTPAGSNITAQGLYENNATISANYTIGTGNNAVSAGPITINSGVVVTVPSGSTWSVV
jgi:hypothetical protein